jgi:3-deoxy-D-manno-octulosonic-acid transferase
MRLIYSFLLALAFIALLPYFIFQALFNRKYLSNLRQRLGILPRSLNAQPGSNLRPTIWIHAVSVGETLTAKPLLTALRAQFPDHRLLLSTTTATGQAVAQSRAPEADGVFYFPFDWKFSVRRALDVINPTIVILMESELWLNFLGECKSRRIPVIVVNGRISDRSFARSQKFGFLTKWLYCDVTRFIMQSRVDADRAVALGAPSERVVVSGNLKYDVGNAGVARKGDETASGIDETFGLSSAPLIIAGSTTEGEEETVLAAFDGLRKEQAFESVRLLIAPRHPERFDVVARLLETTGLRFTRRSIPDRSCRTADVILLDTVGELAALYRLATIVFVGGSLVPKGGHNILEPALYAKPIIVGPHMENFREIAREFLQRDALIQLCGAAEQSLTRELQEAFMALLHRKEYAETLGSNARRAVDENRGATARTVQVISEYL